MTCFGLCKQYLGEMPRTCGEEELEARDAPSWEDSYQPEKQWLRMFDVLGTHHFLCIDAMECRDRVFCWFDRFEASFSATITSALSREVCPKFPLLCTFVNIDPIRGVKDRYMLLRVDTYSVILLWFVWVRFECVLKRLDEFRRLINVGAQVEFRRVWTKMRLFNLCALIFKCMKAIDSWNKNTSDVRKRLYYFS